MEISLLGPLDAESAGARILPTAAKQRQLLALLALHANRGVPVSMLMEEIWEDDPPRSASTTLQTYILQLRRLISSSLGDRSGIVAKEILVYQHGGYQLRMLPGTVDAQEYDRIAARGQAAFDAGDDERAVAAFRRALDLWQGPALADVRAGTFLEMERVRLEESRLGILERRIDVELSMGRHTELLPELTVLTARHGLHEGLHALRVIALYRAGRPSEALSAFSTLRTRLNETLGIEPSPRLQRLNRAVLAGDQLLEQGRRLGQQRGV
ncbi:AfsR/SARP family transcriptional regulator [Streptomyces sp. C11-1]|uniref:AfsR/SARP family transcriptional regulator n=1 Tax=Streptomyces durocortorensis TaxID=2811104 RepID=A0ABY9VVN2_9ACTN|nr:AfsR/SARP family transcriptional regulator [Streptomyces durocortorensis]WNF27987.1 AfsR/SARP family transcriptional regulator [Streptomyces durocortorensis]